MIHDYDYDSPPLLTSCLVSSEGSVVIETFNLLKLPSINRKRLLCNFFEKCRVQFINLMIMVNKESE